MNNSESLDDKTRTESDGDKQNLATAIDKYLESVRRFKDETTREEYKKKITLDTSIYDFIVVLGHKNSKTQPGQLPYPLYSALYIIGECVDTIGELKKLAEAVDGYERLKQRTVYFNEGRCLPVEASKYIGKGKLEQLNQVLAEYGIDPIPWISRKYYHNERMREKGRYWYKSLKI